MTRSFALLMFLLIAPPCFPAPIRQEPRPARPIVTPVRPVITPLYLKITPVRPVITPLYMKITPIRPERPPSPTKARSIIGNAQAYLKARPHWYVDCSQFVRACVASPRLDGFLKRHPSGGRLTLGIYRYLRANGVERQRLSEIQPGDILFFHKTYDADRDGSIDSNDAFTHVGIAESFRNGVLTYIDASKSRRYPILRRRSFSTREGGKNERVATDPRTGRAIRHRETYAAAFGFP